MANPPPRRDLVGLDAHNFLRSPKITHCIFCGRPEVSNEHVWSKWLREYIPRTMTKWETHKSTEHPTEIESAVRKRPGDPHDWQVACVCKKCNNGWMSGVEKRVRKVLPALVDGKCARLSEADQASIATWIALKTMVAEYDDPERVTAHHMQRKFMYDKKMCPSRGWRIWVGNYTRSDWVPHYINNTMSILPGSRPPDRPYMPVKRYNTQSATQIIGKLFVHVIHSPFTKLVERWEFVGPVEGMLRQIWPITGYSIVWPIAAMDDLTADAAAGQFIASCRAAAARQNPNFRPD